MGEPEGIVLGKTSQREMVAKVQKGIKQRQALQSITKQWLPRCEERKEVGGKGKLCGER